MGMFSDLKQINTDNEKARVKLQEDKKTKIAPLPTTSTDTKPEFASKPANQQVSKPVSLQDGLPANGFTSKSANPQASKLLKKFTSYLTEESIKDLKRIAFNSDKKDYEVLQEAVNEFLSTIKK